MALELGIPYWLDFHDPMQGTLGPGFTHLAPDGLHLTEAQLLCLSDSSRITTCSEAYAEHLRRVLPEIAAKVECLQLTYNVDESLTTHDSQSSETLEIVHAGYVNGLPDRSAVPLLRAMARLNEGVPWARGRVILHLVGRGPGVREARDEARRLGLESELRCSRPVHPDVLRGWLNAADVLCVLKTGIKPLDYQIPGKTFDYLFSTKPILALTSPGELTDIIEATGSGFAVQPSDTDRLASVLGELLQKKRTGTIALRRDAEKLRPYSYETFREKLRRILADCSAATRDAMNEANHL